MCIYQMIALLSIPFTSTLFSINFFITNLHYFEKRQGKKLVRCLQISVLRICQKTASLKLQLCLVTYSYSTIFKYKRLIINNLGAFCLKKSCKVSM